MEMKIKQRQIATALETVCQFLEPYLPLANAHNTDFFTENHWEKLLYPSIADDLLKLRSDQMKRLPNGKTYSSCTSCTNSKKEHAERTDNKSSESIDTCKEPCNISKVHTKWKSSLLPDWKHITLEEFVCSCTQHSLTNLNVLTNNDELCISFDLTPDFQTPYEIDSFMSAKKSHEVHIMAQTCSAICKRTGIENIVDIGSGKGYLATELSFQHRLSVIGVDSSAVNTNSADVRKDKLKKYWPGLVHKARAEKSKEVNKHCQTCENVAACIDICKCDHFQEKVEHKPVYITHHVTKDTDLLKMFQEAGDFNRETPQGTVALTGLHTCGNLASAMLKIFSENPQTGLLFNIGCCYHLIDEEFSAGPHEKDDTIIEDYGFPLSDYLKSKGFKLGRNSRMLACQAVDRLVTEEKLPDESLFYRAVLQVILQDITGEKRNDWQIGKIAQKSKNFEDYTVKALEKLKIDHELTMKQIEDYFLKYSDLKIKLNCYFQLRSCLAPCIETVILLDRLLFLLEKDNVDKAFLVQMFDPVKSPRCYAIIAAKNIFTDEQI